MTIQIIGVKGSPDTRKAQRFFSDRGVQTHLVDLRERALSRGELQNIAQALGADALIDTDGRVYRDRGMQYMEFDPIEELVERPLLMRVPVVRNGSQATVGHAPQTWERWLERQE